MARTRALRSATTQFFINLADNHSLDHRSYSPDEFGYAVFGRVIAGMDVVEKISLVQTTVKDGMENVPTDAGPDQGDDGEAVTRPLLIIFLTILVNLIGFGIIIPLLPFYAQTFGASPLAIGLLFASFSFCQLIAAPLLGDWSDRWGRRPILIFSLLGTVVSFAMLALAHSLAMLFAARIVDGLSGGNISTARAYIGDITTDENRARAFGLLGAAFGLGFIIGPGLGGLFARISYTAPIWAAAIITIVAAVLAWLWLPETVHRVHADSMSPWKALSELSRRPGLRLLLTIDFLYWMSFAVYQTTFALFGARRFNFDATHIGYLLSAFGLLGVIVQVGLVGPDRPRARRAADADRWIAGGRRRLGRQRADALVAGLRLRCWCRARSASASAIRRSRRWSAAQPAVTSRAGSRAPRARSRAWAGRSVRSGATARCSCSVRERRTDRRRSC